MSSTRIVSLGFVCSFCLIGSCGVFFLFLLSFLLAVSAEILLHVSVVCV